VVVLGGGFAGLETAFMLRMALGPAVDITVVSDQSSFVLEAEHDLHPVRRRRGVNAHPAAQAATPAPDQLPP
jgi:NADH dehydrogenase FAD-containing subunit